jgi:hypothetical protein
LCSFASLILVFTNEKHVCVTHSVNLYVSALSIVFRKMSHWLLEMWCYCICVVNVYTSLTIFTSSSHADCGFFRINALCQTIITFNSLWLPMISSKIILLTFMNMFLPKIICTTLCVCSSSILWHERSLERPWSHMTLKMLLNNTLLGMQIFWIEWETYSSGKMPEQNGFHFYKTYKLKCCRSFL